MGLDKLLDHHRRQVNRKAWTNLRPFTEALVTAGQLKTVSRPVSPHLQITALCHRSLVNDGPALLFEKPQGFSMPVLGNLFGNEKRVLAALELEKRQDLFELGRELAFLQESAFAGKPAVGTGRRTGFCPPRPCHTKNHG